MEPCYSIYNTGAMHNYVCLINYVLFKDKIKVHRAINVLEPHFLAFYEILYEFYPI